MFNFGIVSVEEQDGETHARLVCGCALIQHASGHVCLFVGRECGYRAAKTSLRDYWVRRFDAALAEQLETRR